jgi:hypothetical protein
MPDGSKSLIAPRATYKPIRIGRRRSRPFFELAPFETRSGRSPIDCDDVQFANVICRQSQQPPDLNQFWSRRQFRLRFQVLYTSKEPGCHIQFRGVLARSIAVRSNSATLASISSSSIALAAWPSTESAALTLVAGGVAGSTMTFNSVETAAEEAC